jgi:hypothetical protein
MTMTDPATALALFILAGAMVIAVIGCGVWMSVRAGNADYPPLQRDPVPEPPVLGSRATDAATTPPTAPAATIAP